MKRLIYILLCAAILVGCSQTKFVPKGSYLLTDVDLKVDNKKVSKSALSGVIQQKPVRKFLGIPFELWIYDLSDSIGKTHFKRWINKTLQKIGTPPAVFDSSLYTSSLEGITQYLNSKGYYNAIVRDSLVYRKNKFVTAKINVQTNTPYRLLNYHISGSDSSLIAIVRKNSTSSMLKRGMIFDSDVLEKERDRIVSSLKNEGYYSFNKSYIVYEADSTVGGKGVALNLLVKNSSNYNADSGVVEESQHEKYIVKEVNVYTNYEPTMALTDKEYTSRFSTYVYNGLNIKYLNRQNVTSELVNRAVQIKPDELYDNSQVNATYNNFSGLKMFRTITIQFNESEKNTTANSNVKNTVNFENAKELVCNIFLTPMLLQGYKVEGELYLASQIWGVAGNLGYSHLNLFKGAEQLNLNFNGTIDFLRGNQQEDVINQINKSTEYGVSSSIYVPRFLMPFNLQKKLKLQAPKTQFSGSYNFQSRPYYTRNLVNFGFGYSWMTKKKFAISYTPINLSIIKMSNDDSLKKYLGNKPLLAATFSNHFISSGIFSIVYNTQQLNSQSSYFYSILNIEAGGNVVSLFNPILKKIKSADNSSVSSIWGMPYAQFVGTDYTVVYNQRLDSKNRVVYRFQIGASFPYGNSSALPYEKYYYVGGANSMRGWQVRMLGPGAASDSVMRGLGDFKLEGNLEYRYKLFWSLEGGVFLDAGNVWFLPRDHRQSNETFKIDTFLSQIATNTGLGLRLNLGYLIVRFDVGIKMIDPTKPYGNRFLLSRMPKSDNFSYHIGIGYPF
ncbi:BamA/TamA family outer membrane protein [uncultured Acetobacteroides sp.]|uniref:translocation and assembly module lipoprotein TamL n=1 Tax=uncultured Acetobacteroides sp. TaxID=1760811 RepID=UPI0029F50B17|nr:BamA/TamA family outer membrane protein [uncultured Acetobacteroides sp.]